jgi:hypothetical protein
VQPRRRSDELAHRGRLRTRWFVPHSSRERSGYKKVSGSPAKRRSRRLLLLQDSDGKPGWCREAGREDDVCSLACLCP